MLIPRTGLQNEPLQANRAGIRPNYLCAGGGQHGAGLPLGDTMNVSFSFQAP